MPTIRGILGLVSLLLIAWLLSTDRRRFPWKIAIVGLGLQWALALLVLRTRIGRVVFDAIGRMVVAIIAGADGGAEFVFGPLAGNHPDVAWKAIVGIKIATTIIIFATISSVGYHFGILQRAVSLMAVVMRRTMGVSGAESLAGAANVFVGQTEAPLLVRPYLLRMTRSELMALMTGGFATVAAGVMAVYIGLLSHGDPEAGVQVARHLLTACLMSAPAALVIAKIMVPEREVPETANKAITHAKVETENLIDAVVQGASDGMKLAINVLAMLIAFVALVTLVDKCLIALGELPLMGDVVFRMGLERLDLNSIFGLILSPLAWIIGVESGDCRLFAGLLGKAMTTNELIAYNSLASFQETGAMSKQSILIATYSLCGFANISSIGIQIGGIGGLVPERRSDLIRLGPRAMLGGALACWTTGNIAGMLLD